MHEAIVVLTNTDTGINAVTAWLDAAGPQPGPGNGPAPTDLTPYAGPYISHVRTLTFQPANGGLVPQFDISGDPGLQEIADQNTRGQDDRRPRSRPSTPSPLRPPGPAQ
jgi:hypothetical protein